eukprot:scaffold87940_cov32-Tisochrysis_lutea.AAC.3
MRLPRAKIHDRNEPGVAAAPRIGGDLAKASWWGSSSIELWGELRREAGLGNAAQSRVYLSGEERGSKCATEAATKVAARLDKACCKPGAHARTDVRVEAVAYDENVAQLAVKALLAQHLHGAAYHVFSTLLDASPFPADVKAAASQRVHQLAEHGREHSWARERKALPGWIEGVLCGTHELCAMREQDQSSCPFLPMVGSSVEQIWPSVKRTTKTHWRSRCAEATAAHSAVSSPVSAVRICHESISRMRSCAAPVPPSAAHAKRSSIHHTCCNAIEFARGSAAPANTNTRPLGDVTERYAPRPLHETSSLKLGLNTLWSLGARVGKEHKGYLIVQQVGIEGISAGNEPSGRVHRSIQVDQQRFHLAQEAAGSRLRRLANNIVDVHLQFGKRPSQRPPAAMVHNAQFRQLRDSGGLKIRGLRGGTPA